MNEEDKKVLLQIARKSIESVILDIRLDETQMQINNPELKKQHGAFVTLRTHGRLRGCIGRLASDTPLHEVVSRMAVSAAIEDPRFQASQIQPSELDDLEIEISVLSPLQKIGNPLDFELGKHGIYIKKGFTTGCFLPQVATETGWTKEEFLSQCCYTKAGLSPNAWNERGVDVYVFTAEIISEEPANNQ